MIQTWLAAKLMGGTEIISRVFKVIWVLLKSFWPIIVMTASFMWALLPVLQASAESMVARADATWNRMTAVSDVVWARATAGFPPAWADGAAFVNSYIPLAEMVIMVASLMITYALCSIIRVIKSFLIALGG